MREISNVDWYVVVESFDAVVTVLFSSGELVLIRNERRAWEFPGGHREGNESYGETAAREAHEEAGARITGIKYLGHYTTPAGSSPGNGQPQGPRGGL